MTHGRPSCRRDVMRFDPAFAREPIVTVTLAGAKLPVATVGDLEPDRTRIRFRRADGGQLADPTGFHVVAVGCD